jgi:hypothetical protein
MACSGTTLLFYFLIYTQPLVIPKLHPSFFGFWATEQYMLNIFVSHTQGARGHVPSSIPLLMPLSFQTPDFLGINYNPHSF